MSVPTFNSDPRQDSSSRLVLEEPATFVYLVKDCKFNVEVAGSRGYRSTTESPIKLKEFVYDSIQLGGDHPRSSSLHVASIADYVKTQRAAAGGENRSPFLTFYLGGGTKRKRYHFCVGLSADFFAPMKEILPGPSLEIRVGVLVPLRAGESRDPSRKWTYFQFGKLLQLRGGLGRNYHISNYFRRASLFRSGSEQLSCSLGFTLSIIVGWRPLARPDAGTALLKLSTDCFLHALFENETSKDVTILVGSGAELKCHKLIFSAHSPVLAAMLSPENGMREGQTGRMELRENSEEGVRQLLRYLYCMEVDTSELSCEVALELFKTAHKYELTHLENSLRVQLLRRGKEWYEPDFLLELYYHARNVKDLGTLRDHSLNIMASMPGEIRSCERFKELKKEDGMELLWKLLDSPRLTVAIDWLSKCDERSASYDLYF